MKNPFIQVSTAASLLRAAVFTLGHFCIDIMVISSITGADMATSTLASMIGPVMNGLWFLIIDRVWSSAHAKDEAIHNFERNQYART